MKEKNTFFDYNEFAIERPFDFSLHSSIGCGGVARLAVYPRTEKELMDLIEKLTARKQGFITVGNLTNSIIPDLGTEKVVICMKKMTKTEIFHDKNSIYVESGVTSGSLLRILRKACLSGAEFVTGIPCTMGGALYMNAGAGGQYLSDIVESVRVLHEGKMVVLSKEECAYSYKQSAFMNANDIILGATLRLEKSDEHTILSLEKEWRERRRHLPKGKSMGCIFKNPEGKSAGALIESAGLKGLRVGGAKVSEVHANFIINDGRATAREVCTLIQLIKNAVFAYCGVLLEEEIQFLN